MPGLTRILIIDDEKHCREALRSFLQPAFPKALIVGEASSVAEAALLLPQLSPDLLLLDVSLEDGTGFDLLDRFQGGGFKVIFTTAHDEFAIKAFRYSALDYLLKPVDGEELLTAVQKLSLQGNNSLHHHQLNHLLHNTS